MSGERISTSEMVGWMLEQEILTSRPGADELIFTLTRFGHDLAHVLAELHNALGPCSPSTNGHGS